MKYTTIALTPKLKEELKGYCKKGEKYSDVIERLLDIAKEHKLRMWLMDETDTIPIEQAIKEAKEKWPE